jgi:hypothetical protein
MTNISPVPVLPVLRRIGNNILRTGKSDDLPGSVELDECVPGLHSFGKRGGREDIETVLHHSLARLRLLT